MLNMAWPIMIVVCANVCYHLSSKSVPGQVNAFASLTATYIVAAVASLVLFFITSPEKNFFAETMKLNWASIILGLAIVGLEFGYIYVYRVGWKISLGSLVANISLACVLMVIGALFFKDALTLKEILGAACCVVGLILVNI